MKTLELLRMQISSTSSRRFRIYIVYRPPRGTKLSRTETEFYSDLDILFTDAFISTIPVIILGDFNVHFDDEPKFSRLRNMLNDYQMQQHIHSAAHELGNILDLAITHQRDNIVSNKSVIYYAISHDYCVECTSNVFINPCKARFEQKRGVKHIQMVVFVNAIKVNNTQMKTGDLSVDKMLHAFNNILCITLNKHAPLIHLIKKPSLDREMLNNYRPISNLSFYPKLLRRSFLFVFYDIF